MKKVEEEVEELIKSTGHCFYLIKRSIQLMDYIDGTGIVPREVGEKSYT